MNRSKIEWTDVTWNPTRGCWPVSPGCANCYSDRQAVRMSGPGGHYEGLVNTGGKWTGAVRLVTEKLTEPLRWGKPRRVFVDSMSDLFHEGFTNEQIAAVFGVMATTPQHTYQVVTKRPGRALAWFEWASEFAPDDAQEGSLRAIWEAVCRTPAAFPESWDHDGPPVGSTWPLPNVHLLVSCEDQQRANERIPLLLRCPAAVRGVSLEPLLGPIDLTDIVTLDPPGIGPTEEHRSALDCDVDEEDDVDWRGATLDWVIVGGESGPNARPMHPDWVRSLRDQCRTAGVPFFFKQWGEWTVASHENGIHGHVMPEHSDRFTWLGFDGETRSPSSIGMVDPVYAMAKLGKRRCGDMLDGHRYRMFPGDRW